MMRYESVMPYTIIFLTYCIRDISAKLFEGKSKKVARLTQELAKLEADRLSKLVVVFGFEVSASIFYISYDMFTCCINLIYYVHFLLLSISSISLGSILLFRCH